MFDLGERVRCIRRYGDVSVGETGTVVYYRDGWTGVAWDEYDIGKHNCDGRCDNGYGYYVEEGCIVRYCPSMNIDEFI